MKKRKENIEIYEMKSVMNIPFTFSLVKHIFKHFERNLILLLDFQQLNKRLFFY